jgi:hypothetical protein
VVGRDLRLTGFVPAWKTYDWPDPTGDPKENDVIEIFTPLIEAARGLDLSNPEAAEAELERRLSAAGDAALALNGRLQELLDAGSIADRGEPPVRWSRVAKATEETERFSIDAVHMSGPGPRHRHPAGEIDYCIALEGEPTFDGRPPGWVVLPPDSVHVPTVSGGTMLIVYLLPDGAMEFLS